MSVSVEITESESYEIRASIDAYAENLIEEVLLKAIEENEIYCGFNKNKEPIVVSSFINFESGSCYASLDIEKIMTLKYMTDKWVNSRILAHCIVNNKEINRDAVKKDLDVLASYLESSAKKVRDAINSENFGKSDDEIAEILKDC